MAGFTDIKFREMPHPLTWQGVPAWNAFLQLPSAEFDNIPSHSERLQGEGWTFVNVIPVEEGAIITGYLVHFERPLTSSELTQYKVARSANV